MFAGWGNGTENKQIFLSRIYKYFYADIYLYVASGTVIILLTTRKHRLLSNTDIKNESSHSLTPLYAFYDAHNCQFI
jgi:hypothetical protein